MDRNLTIITLLILGSTVNTNKANLQCPQKEEIDGTVCENTGAERMICRSNETCEDHEFCSCRKGYIKHKEGVAITCEDINECQSNNLACGANTYCKNLIGSYYCECNPGFKRNNETVFCPDFINTTNNKCDDINECENSPCTNNTVCHNTIGSYSCSCQNGTISIPSKSKTPNCVQCKDDISKDEKNQSCAQQWNCLLQKTFSSGRPTCSQNKTSQKRRMEEFLSKLGDLLNNESSFETNERLKKLGNMLQTVEQLARILAMLYRNIIKLTHSPSNTTMSIFTNFTKKGNFSLRSQWSTVTLDVTTAANDNLPDSAMVGLLEYPKLSSLLAGAPLLGQNSTAQNHTLISPVLSIFVTRNDTKNLTNPITINIRHNAMTEENRETLCVFWSHSYTGWSSDGCHKVNSTKEDTTCECTHLTSFAILMALNVDAVESWTLSLITKIGLSISIICLTLALITFCFCRAIRGTRNTIHTHLCATLLLGNCIFLLGITPTDNETLCSVVAGVLHALYLSSFCWMALEGLELYLMLVRVFDTHLLKKKHLLMVGYGVPAFIVIISAAVFPKGYGTKKHCWLSNERGFIWSFMGPICVIIMVNCGMFILTVWKLADKMASINPDQGKLKRIRSLTATSVAQLCVLGCCWVFGFLMFGAATSVFAYIFSILNCLQGVQIFLLHCIMLRKVREEYAMWLCAAIHCKSLSSYTEFSSTSNSATQSKAKLSSKETNL
ncbi:adhesion G protein-coupled receptor E5 isoform X2 [Pelobates fuscus]|uniref:adhesion G protein-coupled receptor E5 isoform X2 n=1 Tax=Pelobates fuscus TaxID=191477 RepID=UPI002FE49C65